MAEDVQGVVHDPFRMEARRGIPKNGNTSNGSRRIPDHNMLAVYIETGAMAKSLPEIASDIDPKFSGMVESIVKRTCYLRIKDIRVAFSDDIAGGPAGHVFEGTIAGEVTSVNILECNGLKTIVGGFLPEEGQRIKQGLLEIRTDGERLHELSQINKNIIYQGGCIVKIIVSSWHSMRCDVCRFTQYLGGIANKGG